MQAIYSLILKELRITLRSRQSFAFLLGILLFAGAAMLGYLAIVTRIDAINSRTIFSRTVFTILTTVQLGAFGLLSPVLLATSITSERENLTMELLRSSGITSLPMLAGKWGAAVLFQLLLVVCMLPVLAPVIRLGGVGPGEYFAAGVIVSVTLMTYSMVALAISCWLGRSLLSVVAAFLFVFALACLAPLGMAIVIRAFDYNPYMEDSGGIHYTEFIARSISPISAWLGHSTDLLGRAGGMKMESSSSNAFVALMNDVFLRAHLGLQFVLFTASAALAWIGLRRWDPDKQVGAEEIVHESDAAQASAKPKRWPLYLIDPLRKRQVIHDRENPIYVKEKRVGALAKPAVMLRMGYAVLLFSFIPVFTVVGKPESAEAMRGLAVLTVTFILFFIPILAGSVISKEREEHTLDLLQTTAPSPFTIVWGKFLAALRFIGFVGTSVIILPLLLRMSVAIFQHFRFGGGFLLRPSDVAASTLDFLRILPFLVAFSALYTALAILCSSMARKSAAAIATSYLLIAIFVLLPLAEGPFARMSRELFGADTGDAYPLPAVLFSGALTYVGPVLSPFFYFTSDRPLGAEHFFAQWQSWGLIGLHLALMLSLVAITLWLAARRLEKSLDR